MIKSVKNFNLAESETLMDSTDSKILKMLSENQKAKGCCEKPRDFSLMEQKTSATVLPNEI